MNAHPTCNRREFLTTLTFGGTMLAAGCKLQTSNLKPQTSNQVVFISDSHVCGSPDIPNYHYTQDWLRRTVREILDIRPRCVVSFGDLCFDHGDPRDYEVAAEILQPLKDAAIPVYHATGNHDRRNTFRQHFPEAFAASAVPSELVTVVDLGPCDLILLDSLRGKDGEARGPVDGALGEAQQAWLAAELPRRTRPFLVGAHHAIGELSVNGARLADKLGAFPLFSGYVHGHDHAWLATWETAWKCRRRTFPMLTLPSSGLWGEIGYVVCDVTAERLRAELAIRDSWNPVPGRPHRRLADAILNGRRDLSMEFPFLTAGPME